MNRTLVRSVVIFGTAVFFFLMAAPMSFSTDTGSSADNAVKSSADKTSPVKPDYEWYKGRQIERPEIPQPDTKRLPPEIPESVKSKHQEMLNSGKIKHPEMSKREPKKGGSSGIREMDARIKALEEKLTALEGRIKQLEAKK